MPAKSTWLLKGSVLYTYFSGDVTLDEILECSKEQARLVEQFPDQKSIHYIMDVLQVQEYPRNLAALRVYARPFTTKRAGWLILISTDFFQQHLCNILTRIIGIKTQTCATLSEAYAFLQQIDTISQPEDWPDTVDDTMPQRPSFNG